MTDPFVSDDVLETVLRARAGDVAPADLRARILAAVEADGPRIADRRRGGRPWRLLAVALPSCSGRSARPCSRECPVTPTTHARRSGRSCRSSRPRRRPSNRGRRQASRSPSCRRHRHRRHRRRSPLTTIRPAPRARRPAPSAWCRGAGIRWPAHLTRLIPGRRCFQGSPACATTGRLDRTPGLSVLDPGSGTGRRVVDLADGVTGPPIVAWSPTGDAFAFSVGAGSGFGSCAALYVIAGDRLVLVTTVRGGLGFSWAPHAPRSPSMRRSSAPTERRCRCPHRALTAAPSMGLRSGRRGRHGPRTDDISRSRATGAP